jgi:transcriptional regulator with GAF, ATPase, and Fis domain
VSDFEGHHEATRTVEGGVSSPDGMIVVVTSGPAKGKSFRIPAEIGSVVTVGKAEGNDVVLADDTVSRQHLTIGRVVEGIEVRDLGSTNGTRIGKARIKQAIVEPGTTVKAGAIELVIRVELQGVEIPPSDKDRFGIAIGTSLPMRRIFGLLEKMAPTTATVLLTGETGTGKDVLARSIHQMSPRASHAFEVVDCGAITPTLIESELFGHERGAFTGAVASRTGAFERAAGGTLFLDEIGELPLELQPKLLRVLEAREFRRVGGNKVLTSDARIIAATTRDLARMVTQGKFREDLYFRLAVVPLQVPPLRARPEDIPLLAQKILDATGDRPLHLSSATRDALLAHSFPGNVRELRNVLERSAHFAHASGEDELRLVDFPSSQPVSEVDPDDVFRFKAGMTYREARARVDALFERKYLGWVLDRNGGKVSAAAREAQMDRKYLADLARKHRLT